VSGRSFTRRRLLELGGGAAGLAVLGAESGPARAARPAARNVVVIVLDNVRADYIRSRRVRTPVLDALARQSLSFPRFRPEAFPTIPARRSIMTGRRVYPFRGWRPVRGLPGEPGWETIDRRVPLFTDILGRAGYQTGYVTDNPHILSPAYDRFRGRFDRPVVVKGQTPYRGKLPGTVSEAKVRRHTLPALRKTFVRGRVRQFLSANAGRREEADYLAPRVFTAASEWMERAARAGKPFALVVDSFDPHEPWDPPQEYVDLYSDGYDGPEPIVPNYSDAGWIDEKELERMRALYAAEVTMTDRWVGDFLDRVDSLGFAKNTMVIVLSDHGVALGEHDATGKPFWALYPELTDVPFMIRHPEGAGAGQTSDYYASTHDVAPTVLASLGIEVPGAMGGQDLSVLLDGGQPEQERPHFTLGYDEYVWTRDDRYAMISRNDGAEAKLFDLQEDPGMDTDIAADNQDVVRRMFDDYVIGDADGPLPRY
jgi:arylsulfatase A-like enzyme